MTFEVRWTGAARADLQPLHDFMLDRAESVEELDAADLAIAAIEHAVLHQLGRTPFIFRRAGSGSLTIRELIVPHGATGYVARYDIRPEFVLVLGGRHQREEDYR